MLVFANDCFWLTILIAFDDCVWYLWWLITLNVYNNCIWRLFFVIVHTHKCFDCLILYWLLIITYLSWFLALSVFNFLNISNFLHWVSFRFGSLYFCFGLGCFVTALGIPLCYLSIDVFRTWLIPPWMISYYVNDCVLFWCFRHFDVAKGGENHVRYMVYIFLQTIFC